MVLEVRASHFPASSYWTTFDSSRHISIATVGLGKYTVAGFKVCKQAIRLALLQFYHFRHKIVQDIIYMYLYIRIRIFVTCTVYQAKSTTRPSGARTPHAV